MVASRWYRGFAPARPPGCSSWRSAIADPARLVEMVPARRSGPQRQLAAEGGPEVSRWVILRHIKHGQQVA